MPLGLKVLACLAVFGALSRLGEACKCAQPDFPNCEKPNGIYGEVLSYTITPCPDSDGVNDYALVRVRIEEVFKQSPGLGLQAGNVMTVRSAVQSATCGYFSSDSVGKKYLLTTESPSAPRCDTLATDTNLQISSCDGNIVEPTQQQVRAYGATCGISCHEKCESRCVRGCQRICSGRPICIGSCESRCGAKCDRQCM
jgi:hypothetical protein